MNTFSLIEYPNVKVNFDNLFSSTLDSVESYYICIGCGHIYWFVLDLHGAITISLNENLLISGKDHIGKIY